VFKSPSFTGQYTAHTHVTAISNETMKVYGKAWFKSYGTVHLTFFKSLHFVSSTGGSRGVSH